MEQGNLIVLPPKRFQSTLDAKYDVLRHKHWFAELAKRRAKLGLLKQAYIMFIHTGRQAMAALEFGVDERELRDYIRFNARAETFDVKTLGRAFQHVLDSAYRKYCRDKAEYHIRHYIKEDSVMMTFSPRHVVEAWEIDANFYPTGYPYI